MNGSTTIIVEASGSSTGVILGGVSLGLVLSTLLGLAVYVLRKRGIVTAEQAVQAQKVADEVLKSPVVAAAATAAQVVETAKETVEKSIAASELSVSLQV